MRRRKLLVALAGLAVVLVAGVFILWNMPDLAYRITPEICDRIRVGMNRAEVDRSSTHEVTGIET